MARSRAGPVDEFWKTAVAVSGIIVLWFGAYEVVERLWLTSADVQLLKALHIVRGLGSTVLGVAATLYLVRRGPPALPERSDSVRAPELAGRKASWLIKLRWLAGMGVVVALTGARSLGALGPGTELRLWGGAAALFVFNGALAWRAGRMPPGALPRHLAVDSLMLTYFLHFSGGLENPFFLLYIFHAQVAAILLPRREAARLAGWSAALLTGLWAGEYAGLLRHHPLLLTAHAVGGTCFAQSAAGAGPLLAAFLLVHFGTAFFTAMVMGRLRRDNERLLTTERLSALGRIVGFVAHEVNNPVGVIIARANLALSRPRHLSDPDKTRSSMEVIARQAGRIAAIVQNLLASTSPQSTRLGEMGLAELLDEVAERLAPRFKACGVALERRGGADCVLRDVRFTEVSQVFTAILLNALEATESGGRVRLDVSVAQGMAEVRVTDEGPGIPEPDLTRLFEPFFSTKPRRGSGLGLAMCRAIVRSLGGDVTARNGSEGGAELSVRIPSAPPVREVEGI